jgi:hypothetical protein
VTVLDAPPCWHSLQPCRPLGGNPMSHPRLQINVPQRVSFRIAGQVTKWIHKHSAVFGDVTVHVPNSVFSKLVGCAVESGVNPKNETAS